MIGKWLTVISKCTATFDNEKIDITKYIGSKKMYSKDKVDHGEEYTTLY